MATVARPLDDGFEYALCDDDTVFRAAAEWIVLERRCCPFLAFELAWSTGEAPPALRVTGPAWTREFPDAGMPALPHE